MQRGKTLLILLILALGARAQVNEIGITGGYSYYIGDLNPTRHFPKDKKLAGGLLFRHNFNERYALRLQGLYGTLQAYDSNARDSLQLVRDLHFKAKLIEASLLFEINFFKYRKKGKDGRKWTPFVFGGLAYFRANPQALYDDTWYDLVQLGTEGQGATGGGEPYKVDHLCIPFGGGFKFNLGRIDIQAEWGLRRTWTDYIDDVSGVYYDNARLAFENGPLAAQLADRSGLEDALPGFSNTGRARGDVNTRDWYVYSGISITYIISRFSDCEEQYNWMKRRN
ncbi:MAG: hypothetical protein H6591_03275 [Flavobacteriales bacterium]|nr:hypothetical protein [Flavobacteriales bacterium]